MSSNQQPVLIPVMPQGAVFQPVLPQGVSYQGVTPPGTMPQGTMPQGNSSRRESRYEPAETLTDSFMELPSQPGFQKVVCPPERFIRIAASDLTRALQRNVPDDKHTEFAAFIRLVEATSQFEFLDVRNWLKDDFQFFAAGAAKEAVPLPKREEPPSDELLDKEELRFVTGFDALMEAGFYRRLSQGEWETADREEFTFTMPVEVDWSQNDTSLLGRFWDSHPGEQEMAAEISDRILVYHRGISTAVASGMYLAEKIDLLVSYLVAGPIARLITRQFPQLEENSLLQAVMKVGGGVEESSVQSVPEQLRHKYAKVIYRTSLERQLPDAKSVLSNLFTTLRLSEPQFRSVVVLYREIVTDTGTEPPPAPEDDTIQTHTGKSAADQLSERLERRNIHVKRFENVPIADAELIFPEKTIYLKPITILQLAVTVIGGLVAAFATFWGNRMSWNMIMSLFVILGGRASQVYFSANMQRQAMSDAMTKALYEKTRDSQEGVLHRILEEMTDQHIKESILAYTILLTSSTGRALDQDELDTQCEAYLAQRFGERLDFDISGSLQSLLNDGVVWKDSKGLVTAVPLDEAITKLKEKWAGFFARPVCGLARQADGPQTRNTRLARLAREHCAVTGVPDDQVNKEHMRHLFVDDISPPSPSRRHSIDSGSGPAAIEPLYNSNRSITTLGSPRKKRVSSMLKQLVPGHHQHKQAAS